MARVPNYEAEDDGVPLWASEPYRVFFPAGILAATVGLLLWPLHYSGWWELYPAIQHPRIMIFGFGAAFVFGFLGTAWPRFLESRVLSPAEVFVLLALWLASQVGYWLGSIAVGDLLAAGACLWLMGSLVGRLLQKGDELPPPGFSLAFLAVAFAAFVLLAFGFQWNLRSPEWDHFLRLCGYQGFLLLPILGIGSYLVPRFFPGANEKPVSPGQRGKVVWSVAALVVLSFWLEAYVSIWIGNSVRTVAVLGWAVGAVPVLVKGRAPGTRPWALRIGMAMICVAFICRAIWPLQVFAFEHFLFLGGFTQVILLVADRVATGHSIRTEDVKPRSIRWRWFVWLLILTAATRATADLVPTTRVSHHIYAAVLLVVLFLIWWADNGKRLLTFRKEEES